MAIIIVPVSLQIFSRYTALIPSYIWTEEMARFLFVWMVMIGAMVGVRDGTHFEVDVWPQLPPRANALVRIVSGLVVLGFALVFVWGGYLFTAFAWNRVSELAELPLWMIHIAWPLTGLTWLVFQGEHMADALRVLFARDGAALGEPGMSGGVLSPGTAALILFGIFFALMLLRVPVAFALGLACVPMYFIEPRLDTQDLVQETFNAFNSFILLAVPFFLLTANLMNVGGITDRLVRFSRALVGHFPGGLAQVNVVLSIFFAGVSGSSTADAASQSKIFIEAQTKEGYDVSFSVAITAVSAVMAVIIPPSILMIVWGGVLTVSIGALMLAGIIPGLLIGLAQMATVHAYAKRRGYPTYTARHAARGVRLGAGVGAGADDAVHHRRRQGLRLVHRHRVGRHRGAVRRRADDAGLPRDGLEGPAPRAARHRQAGRRHAVLRRHGQRLRLAAGVLPDPEGAAGQRGHLGHGADDHRRSSSPACSSWSAASSTRSRPSSSSAPSCSRWRRPPAWTRCTSRSSASCRWRSAW